MGCTGPPLPPPRVAALAIGGRSCHVLLHLPCLQPCLFPLSPQTQSPGGPRLCPVCESTVPRTRHHIVGAHWTHEGASSRGLGSGLRGGPACPSNASISSSQTSASLGPTGSLMGSSWVSFQLIHYSWWLLNVFHSLLPCSPSPNHFLHGLLVSDPSCVLTVILQSKKLPVVWVEPRLPCGSRATVNNCLANRSWLPSCETPGGPRLRGSEGSCLQQSPS